MSSSEQSTTLFRNVRVFDGRSPVLSNGSNVLVRGSTIESISTQSIDPGHSEHRVEIDGGGRVLMPGLIDAHWHAMLASMPIAAMMTADIGYLNLVAGEQATRTLHRGFTTVRDAGGPVEPALAREFGHQRAVGRVDAGRHRRLVARQHFVIRQILGDRADVERHAGGNHQRKHHTDAEEIPDETNYARSSLSFEEAAQQDRCLPVVGRFFRSHRTCRAIVGKLRRFASARCFARIVT